MDELNFKKVSLYEGPEKSPGFLLWHLSTAWRTLIEAVLKPLDLTHPQFVILATLGWLTRNGDLVTQIKVGKMAGLDPNTTSQILKGLEKKGLILRKPCLDGRAKNPFLTSLGKKILSKALPFVETTDAEFFKKLKGSEMQMILKLFKKLTVDSHEF